MCSTIIPMHEAVSRPACSGKCMGVCGVKPSIWVIAACDGRISLFRQSPEGRLSIIPQEDSFVSPSVESFCHTLVVSSKKGMFNRLVLIGSTQDIAWVHLSMPASLTKQIIAEIAHPLSQVHFQQLPDFNPLINEIMPLLGL